MMYRLAMVKRVSELIKKLADLETEILDTKEAKRVYEIEFEIDRVETALNRLENVC